MLTHAAAAYEADLILVDLGPNFGAINRCALLAASHLIVPHVADLFSLEGIKNIGPKIRGWQEDWHGRRDDSLVPLDPASAIRPLGYVVQGHPARRHWSGASYDKWIGRIPAEFRRSILGQQPLEDTVTVQDDPWCLGVLKYYHSLMPMAQEARKPMFHLKVADGAIGAHFQAAQSAGRDFEQLARRIAEGAGVSIPRLKDAVTR